MGKTIQVDLTERELEIVVRALHALFVYDRVTKELTGDLLDRLGAVLVSARED